MESSDDWGLISEPVSDDSTRFKWGWNGETGEVTVWEVAGPGDGFPSHHAYLSTAWGRAPRVGGGADVVGFAEWQPPTLAIHAHGATLPEAVEAHFRTAFPGASIIVS